MPSQMTSLYRKKLIISHLFGFDQKITDFLFESSPIPQLRERPQILLNDSWDLPVEQRILIQAALDLWNGSGQLFLSELLKLDKTRFCRLMQALKQIRAAEEKS